MTEKELTSLVVGSKTHPGVARQVGWACYHTLRSKGSEPGFPDWTLARDRVLFIELKTEQGKVSDAQHFWLGKLHGAGGEVYVVRPQHLDAIAWTLARRVRPRMGENPHGDGLLQELSSVLNLW
jgi:hypothetical protein